MTKAEIVQTLMGDIHTEHIVTTETLKRFAERLADVLGTSQIMTIALDDTTMRDLELMLYNVSAI